MKRVCLLTLAILVFAVSVNAQESKITGIGPFVLNRTTTAIVDSLKCEGIEVLDLTTSEGMSICHKVYHIDQLTIGGITVKAVGLNFYNNVLIDVAMNIDENIVDDLKAKYGKYVRTGKGYLWRDGSNKCFYQDGCTILSNVKAVEEFKKAKAKQDKAKVNNLLNNN